MILFELYSATSDGGDTDGHFVRVIYNGKVLELPFCGSEKEHCDFEIFSKYIKTVVPTDEAKQCGVSSKQQKWKWY